MLKDEEDLFDPNQVKETRPDEYYIRKIEYAIDKAIEKIDEAILFNGYMNLGIYINFISEISSTDIGQKYLIEKYDINQIKSLVEIFKQKQVKELMFSLIHIFVNFSFLFEGFIEYFIECGGYSTLLSMNIPIMEKKEPRHFKDYFRLVYNLTSLRPDLFDENQAIIFLKNLTKSSDTYKQYGILSLTNVFRQLSFTSFENYVTVFNFLAQILDGTNGSTNETVAWCIYFQLQNSDPVFFVQYLVQSDIMNGFVDSLFASDNNVLMRTVLTIFSYMVIYGNRHYTQKLFNSNVLQAAIELMKHEHVGLYSLYLVNNFMAIENEYIEFCLQNHVYATALDLFDDGNLAIKEECIRCWTIIAALGNSEQSAHIINEFILEKIIDYISSEGSSNSIIFALKTLIFICDNNPKIAEQLQESDLEVVQEMENAEIQELVEIILKRMHGE